MRGSSFAYLLKEGFRYLYVNRMMSLASIGVLVACLLLTGASYLFSININSLIGHMESLNEIVVFLYDDVPEEDITYVRLLLEELPNITDIRFISKEEALELQRIELGEAASLLDGLEGDENPLPNSFSLSVADLALLESTVAELGAIYGVEKINAPFDAAKTLTGLRNAVNIIGIAVVALLGGVSLLIISNTVRVAIYNRRREINIMKYVGATDSFIRLPFIIEGGLMGLISAALSYAVLWLGYDFLAKESVDSTYAWLQFISGSLVSFSSVSLPLLIGFAGGGLMLGAFGSAFFVKRHLKV